MKRSAVPASVRQHLLPNNAHEIFARVWRCAVRLAVRLLAFMSAFALLVHEAFPDPAPAPNSLSFAQTTPGGFEETVPDGVCAVQMSVRGGAGASGYPFYTPGYGQGGGGAVIRGKLRVLPLQAVSGIVGQGGSVSQAAIPAISAGGTGASPGGRGGIISSFPPGATNPQPIFHRGGGGGGSSSVSIASTKIIEAGGGGGGGAAHLLGGNGGSGGVWPGTYPTVAPGVVVAIPGPGVYPGLSGEDGWQQPTFGGGVHGGQGGGVVAHGLGGINILSTPVTAPRWNGLPGTAAGGGDGGVDGEIDSGGGGGGGYFNGGGGASTDEAGRTGGGGGGGASFIVGNVALPSFNLPTLISGFRDYPTHSVSGNGANGSVSMVWVPCNYSLNINKTVSPNTINAGGTVIWTVTVQNVGPDPMTRGDTLTLTDLLPGPVDGQLPTYKVLSFTTSGGTNPIMARGAMSCTGLTVGATMPSSTTCERPYDAPSAPGAPNGGTRGLDPGETLTISYEQIFPENAACATITNTASVVDRRSGWTSSTQSANAATTINEKCATGMVVVSKQLSVPEKSNLQGVSFPVSVTCGAVQNDGLVNVNAPLSVTGLPLTETCTVHEETSSLRTEDICPGAGIGTWTASYSPSQTVTPTVDGTAVEIINTLTCDYPADGVLSVQKVVVQPQGATVPDTMKFPVSVDCGSVEEGEVSVNTPWLLNNLPTHATCTVAEHISELPTSGVCPPNQTANWTTTPAQTVTPTAAGATVTITNTLRCSAPPPQPPIPVEVRFTKKVINNTSADLSGLAFTINTNCTGSSGTPATVSLQDAHDVSVFVMPGTACAPTEVTPGFTASANNYCASKGLIPTWSTSVVPQASQTIAGAGTVFGIENTFGCTAPPPVKVEFVKKVINKTQADLSGLVYAINTNCSGNSATQPTLSLQDGQSTVVTVTQGSTCAPTETAPTLTADAQKYCSALGLLPSWSTKILPQSSLVVPAIGGTITVENTFDCAKPAAVNVEFYKRVINKTQADLSNLTYTVNTNCTGSTLTPATVNLHEGMTVTEPVMQGGACAPTEVPPSITADMEKFCAGQGLVPMWSTQVMPSGPLTIQTSGASFGFENTFDCTKPEIGGVKITKVCERAKPGQTNGANNGFHTVCHITVTTNGPIPAPGLEVGDVVLPVNVVPAIAQTSGPAWTCSGSSCNAAPSVLGNSSASVFDTYIDFPDANAVADQNNCASTVGAFESKACSSFALDGKLTGISIIKRVVSNAPDVLPSVPFPITATCGPNVSSISDGQTITINNLASGTACTVQEGDLTSGVVSNAAADACNGSGQPVWTTSYSPSQTVTATAGAAVTITNTLNCAPLVKGFTVKKVLVSNAPGSVAGLAFPITSTCGPNTPSANSPMTVAMAAGTSGVIFGGAVGDTCTITEATYPATDACGSGALPVWTQNISPSTFVVGNTNPNITVTNTLDCKKIAPPVRQIFVKKVVVNNSPGSVAGLSFPITSTCGPNTTSAHSPMTVGYSDGLTAIFGGVQGDTCTISEPSYPATNACKDQKPVWSTIITPSPTLTVSANNPLITVTNTLDCKPPEGHLTIKKVVIKPQGAIVPDTMQFPVQVNCGAAQNGIISVNMPWSLGNLSTSTACIVSEDANALPVKGICPAGQIGSWVVTPQQTVVPTSAGTTVIITNRLSCKESPPDGPVKIELTKKVINNTQLDLSNLTYSVDTNCTGSHGTPATVHLQDKQTITVPVTLGSTCRPTEVTPDFTTDAEKYCAALGLVPHWSTVVVPQQSLTITSAGGAFTFENTFDCVKSEEVKVEIAKAVRNNTPANLSGLDFYISPNCSPNAASPALVQLAGGAAATFVTTKGSTCTPSELAPGFTTEAKKYCETRGLVPAWSKQVFPRPSITIGAKGTVITVQNIFDCVKPGKGGAPALSVSKSCVLTSQITPTYGAYNCTLTVTALGSSLPPVISLSDILLTTSTGTLMGIGNISSVDPWTCNSGNVNANSPSTCSIPGNKFPSTGTSTLNAIVYLDSKGVQPGSTQNCVSVEGNSTPPVSTGPVCVPFGAQSPSTGILSVVKEATIDGHDIPQMKFDVSVTCGKTVHYMTVINGGPAKTIGQIPLGSTCSVIEESPDTAGVCPQGKTASWNTIYSPSVTQPFTAQNASQVVKIKNSLTCSPTEPALKCDRETAKLVDGQCHCTIRGMKPWSKTECRCLKGQEVRDGQCSDIPPPPAPKCDTRSTILQGGKCMCKVPGAVPVSKTACGCPDGTELIKGQCRVHPPEVKCDARSAFSSNGKCVCKVPGAVPVSTTACGCPVGTELTKGKCRVSAPVLKCDGKTAVAKGGACVCKFRGMRPVSETECACRAESTFVPGIGCVAVPADCPEGTVRKGAICIRIKTNEPRGKECPPETHKVGPLCVPFKLKNVDPTPSSPQEPGKVCQDREGKMVPCN